LSFSLYLYLLHPPLKEIDMPLKEFGSHVFIETLQGFRNRLHGQLNKSINLFAQTLNLGRQIKFPHKVPHQRFPILF
jgi:hypothetical protein